MNAETRAKEIVQELCKPLDGGRPFFETPHRKLMAEIITQALRQAENDKLEEAARAAEQSHLGMSCFVEAVDCGQFNSGVRHAAKAVRNLISQKD